MHDRRSQSPNLEPVNLKLEKTLYTLRHVASKVKIEDKIEINLEQPQALEEEYFSPLKFKHIMHKISKCSY